LGKEALLFVVREVSPLTDLIFVTKSQETYDVFDRQLKAFLPEHISVKGFSLDAVESVDCGEAKVVLLSSADCRKVLRFRGSDPKVLVSRRTLDPSRLGPLFTLEPKTNVLVVNNAEDVSRETAQLIAAFGLDMLNLIPWWPGAVLTKPRPTIAVTPGLPGIVPGSIATVYDVGTRPIDASSLVEVGLVLGISLDGIAKENASNYQGVVRVIREQADLFRRVDSARNDLEAILDSVHDAVIMADEDLRIHTLNTTAALVLGLDRSAGGGEETHGMVPRSDHGSSPAYGRCRGGPCPGDQREEICGHFSGHFPWNRAAPDCHRPGIQSGGKGPGSACPRDIQREPHRPLRFRRHHR
jgi:PAS domain-containing protein